MVKILIFLVLLWFYVLYPLIFYWAPRMESLWGVKFVFGKMGVGKSGLIAISSIKDMSDPNIDYVYTTIGVPGTCKFDAADINKGLTFPPKSSVYIDEVGLLYNSRDFKNFPKQAREFFKYCRQNRIKCTCYSQAPDLDKSVRDLAFGYSMLRRIGPFTLEFDISKNIDVGSDMQGNGQLIDNYFKLGILGGLHIHYLPRYFKLWDSFDPPLRHLINSDFVSVTPEVIRAKKFGRFYKYNFRVVYEDLIRRVSAIKHSVSVRLLDHAFFIGSGTFNMLQELNLEPFEP